MLAESISLPIKNDYIAYLVPFGAWAAFTYIGPILNCSPAIVYPLKTIVVAGILFLLIGGYKYEIKAVFDLSALIAGVLVFVVWIVSENHYPRFSQPEGFDPFSLGHGASTYSFIGFRLVGAVLIVPVMEELFWRSFALRYLINPKFKDVPLGQFSWFSFTLVSLAFGFEHHRWLPGIFAGAVYAGLLYRSKNLFAPILSHAVTNLLLGIYVLATGQWVFW